MFKTFYSQCIDNIHRDIFVRVSDKSHYLQGSPIIHCRISSDSKLRGQNVDNKISVSMANA